MVMKHYPPEFKAEAVALYRSRPEATIAQIADDHRPPDRDRPRTRGLAPCSQRQSDSAVCSRCSWLA